ncbi:unnamed protein product [Peronospora destructor]|uniref:PPM-type phosphatase domain-containing protein n=1 Tax=Peronospora destructor TaxID=86335 RepID=A0AAV0USK5_9STRA|nr:unnamed protein product [Peronospora destructor]
MLRQDVDDVTDENVVTSYVESIMEGGALHASLSALGRVPDEPSKHFDSVLEWVDTLNACLRALGGFRYKSCATLPAEQQQVSAEPDIKVHKIDKTEEFLVLACDGIWDVMSNDKVCDYIRQLMNKGETDLKLIAGEILDTVFRQEDTYCQITWAVLLWADILLRPVCQFHLQTQLRLNCLKMEFDPHQQHDTCARDRSNDRVIFQDVIMCDTSCSNARAPDNRGGAASEMVVEPSGRMLVNGVLENGHGIKCKLDEDPWVGQWLCDGTMVKARLASENANGEEKSYLVFRVENGYSYSYFYHSVTKLREIGLKN